MFVRFFSRQKGTKKKATVRFRFIHCRSLVSTLSLWYGGGKEPDAHGDSSVLELWDGWWVLIVEISERVCAKIEFVLQILSNGSSFQILRAKMKTDPIFPCVQWTGPVFFHSHLVVARHIFPFPAVNDNIRVPVRRDDNCYCIKWLCTRRLASFWPFEPNIALIFLVSSRWRLRNSPDLHQPPASRGLKNAISDGLVVTPVVWPHTRTGPRKWKRP